MTELLLDTNLDDRQRDYVQTVHKSGVALLVVINDILDFSKIEAGELEVEAIDCDVRTIVEDLMDLMADQAQTKVEASQKLPITLTGMVLFNAWMNGRATGGAEFPTTASHQQLLGRRRDGQPERAGYEIPGPRSFGRRPA